MTKRSLAKGRERRRSAPSASGTRVAQTDVDAGASKPGRRSQRERIAASRRSMMEAALTLIGERGFHAMTLQEVGRRAGYSGGLVSHQFGSKDGLLEALVAELLDGFGAAASERAASEAGGANAVVSALRTHRAALEDSPELVRALYVILLESLVGTSKLQLEFGRFDRQLRAGAERNIAAGIRAGTLREDLDVSAQAVLLVAVARGIVLQWLVAPRELDLARVYRALEDWVARGLGTRATAEPVKPVKKARARKSAP